MKLIVGLGNPGPLYKCSRHNAGFLVVEQLAELYRIPLSHSLLDALTGRGLIFDNPVMLAQPQTFMNLSGVAVRKLTDYFKIPPGDMVVVHDDLDLPFLTIRLKQGGGHGGHKGLISLMDHLNDSNFARVRIGIGRPPMKSMVESYVLSPFSDDERQHLPKLLRAAAEAVVDIITNGVQAAMAKYHGQDNSLFVKEV